MDLETYLSDDEIPSYKLNSYNYTSEEEEKNTYQTISQKLK